MKRAKVYRVVVRYESQDGRQMEMWSRLVNEEKANKLRIRLNGLVYVGGSQFGTLANFPSRTVKDQFVSVYNYKHERSEKFPSGQWCREVAESSLQDRR